MTDRSAARRPDRLTQRRRFLVAMGTGAIGISQQAFAQKRGKVYRIGFLVPDSVNPALDPFLRAMLEGLRRYGYEERKNIELDFRSADGNYEHLPRLAAELIDRRPDVLASVGTPGVMALKNATRAIPIVMVASGDAVATGLIAGLAKPGGNITGSTFFGKELMLKRLQLLKDAVPGVRRVALLVNPDNQTTESNVRAIIEAEKPLNIELLRIDVRRGSDVVPAFQTMRNKKASAVALSEDAVLYGSAKAIAELALDQRLPAVGFTDFADNGGLLGYGASFLEMFRRAGYFIDRLLRGEKPANIPVERPTTFDLVVNLETARALGVKLPQSILVRADKVVGS
ncbi:MAG: ABC transporter substrate-binding protein [Burkholderiales bacterium]|nr:ABC transporter substrate-binding protein [Burkholderiales bacterium]